MSKLKNKFENDFDRDKQLLHDIGVFNTLVHDLRIATEYRSLQLDQYSPKDNFENKLEEIKNINIKDEESQERFNEKVNELVGCLDILTSEIELKYNIRIPIECKYYGILPDCYLSHEVKYFLENKKNKFGKVKRAIQQRLKI